MVGITRRRFLAVSCFEPEKRHCGCVCAVQEWLHDDGVRLMPIDATEWLDMHDVFCRILSEFQIPYTVIPASITDLRARTDLVVSLYRTSLGKQSADGVNVVR